MQARCADCQKPRVKSDMVINLECACAVGECLCDGSPETCSRRFCYTCAHWHRRSLWAANPSGQALVSRPR